MKLTSRHQKGLKPSVHHSGVARSILMGAGSENRSALARGPGV